MAMKTTHVNIWDWLHRVLGWDGLLPVCIAVLPTGIDFVLPNNADALTIAAVTAPIAALFVRFSVGRRHLASNQVGPAVRACQYCVFTAAIFLLCLIDCFVIIIHVVPAVPATDWSILGALFSLYLIAMSFAMFPGRTENSMAWTADCAEKLNDGEATA
jgi:hypothetical protein